MDMDVNVHRRRACAIEEDWQRRRKRRRKKNQYIYILKDVLTFSYSDVCVLYLYCLVVYARVLKVVVGGAKTQYNNGRTRKYATYTTRGGELYYKYKTHIRYEYYCYYYDR